MSQSHDVPALHDVFVTRTRDGCVVEATTTDLTGRSNFYRVIVQSKIIASLNTFIKYLIFNYLLIILLDL